MKAARIHNLGIQNVNIDQIDEPICYPDSVKVKIYATSVNHLDLWVTKGISGIKIKLPFTLGSDASGMIVEVGKNIQKWKVGDKVIVQPGLYCNDCIYCNSSRENLCIHYGILGETHNGTHCEYITLDPKYLYPKFPHLTYNESAAVPLTFMTAYEMLLVKGKLNKGDNVLIYGATSGVGSAAIKISKSIGANIFTTVGSKNKIDFAKKCGADFVFLHDSKLCKKIKNIVDSKGVQLVIEHIGESTWDTSRKVLSRGGRIVTCGATTGKKVSIDLQHLFYKQQKIIGSTMSSIDSFKKMLNFINKNLIVPSIDRVFNIDKINEAYKYILDRKQKGKIVISIDKDSHNK